MDYQNKVLPAVLSNTCEQTYEQLSSHASDIQCTSVILDLAYKVLHSVVCATVTKGHLSMI